MRSMRYLQVQVSKIIEGGIEEEEEELDLYTLLVPIISEAEYKSEG